MNKLFSLKIMQLSVILTLVSKIVTIIILFSFSIYLFKSHFTDWKKEDIKYKNLELTFSLTFFVASCTFIYDLLILIKIIPEASLFIKSSWILTTIAVSFLYLFIF